MVLSLFWVRPDNGVGMFSRALLALSVWGVLCVLQPLVGYATKLVACAYVLRHNAAQGGKPGVRVIHKEGAGGAAGSGVAGKAGGGGASATAGGGIGSGLGSGTQQTLYPTPGVRPKAE